MQNLLPTSENLTWHGHTYFNTEISFYASLTAVVFCCKTGVYRQINLNILNFLHQRLGSFNTNFLYDYKDVSKEIDEDKNNLF